MWARSGALGLDPGMSSDPRQNTHAYAVILARGPEFWARAAVARGCWLTLVTIAALGGGSARWWVWPILALGFTAALLAWRIARHERYDTTMTLPLLATIQRISNSTKGTTTWNVQGTLEMTVAATIVALGPWGMADASTNWRFVALAGAVGYVWNFLAAVTLDPVFYNPAVGPQSALELVRSGVGVLSALVGCLIVVPASWPAGAMPVAAGIVLSVSTIQLRINETDRMLRYSGREAQLSAAKSRVDIVQAVHSMLGTPVERVMGEYESRRNEDRQFYDLLRNITGGYYEVIALEHHPERDAAWPGALIGSITRMLGATTMSPPRFPDSPLTPENRVIARHVLQDLASNLVKNGARYCEFALVDSGDNYIATAFDDGRPVDSARWKRQGGGIERLERLHKAKGLLFTYAPAHSGEDPQKQGKVITVVWHKNER